MYHASRLTKVKGATLPKLLQMIPMLICNNGGKVNFSLCVDVRTTNNSRVTWPIFNCYHFHLRNIRYAIFFTTLLKVGSISKLLESCLWF